MRCWLLLGGLVHDEFGIELEQAYRIEQYQLRELCGFYITPFPIDLLQRCDVFFGLRRMSIYIRR